MNGYWVQIVLRIPKQKVISLRVMIVTYSLLHTHRTHCHIIEPWFYNFYWNHVHGICTQDCVLNVLVNLIISGFIHSTKSIFLWKVWWNIFGFYFLFLIIWRRDVIAVSSFNLQIACLNCSANCHWARLEINWCNWVRLRRDLEKLSKALWARLCGFLLWTGPKPNSLRGSWASKG